MIEISENVFNQVYAEFKARVESDANVPLVNFNTHPFIEDNENYKYGVLEDAKNKLLTRDWKEAEIGKGRIIKFVRDAIYSSIKTNNSKFQNNLLDWRKKDDFKNLKPSFENEKTLFDFFKSKIKDEDAFNRFSELGFSYQLIAYLFFIKNSQKYMPISQEQFDLIFKSLSLDFHTSHNISWDNYVNFNEIIKTFRIHLSRYHSNITLLDAHSFLWIYGFKFEKDKKKIKLNPPEQKRIVKEQETYQPIIPHDLEEIPADQTEIDYIELHRRLIEIGAKAEKYVYQNEIDFLLGNGFPSLAEKVRIVSSNPSLGFDILSFETTHEQKQIEVKAISTNKHHKSFILTRNELAKSKVYKNYYVYCVADIDSDKPKIIRLKNPNFDNMENFRIEPLTYKVSFE